MARRFVSVTRKINLLILVSLTLGIGSITLFLTLTLSRTIDDTTEDALSHESAVIYRAIEHLMIPGQAPLVEGYFASITDVDADLEIDLYRRNGVRAFSDNETIDRVNSFNDARVFARRELDPATRSDTNQSPLFLAATGMPPRNVMQQEQIPGGMIVEFYRPLLNLPKCTACHQPDHTVRGVIRIRADISESIRQRQQAVAVSAGAFFIVFAAISFLMTSFVRFQFISPLKEIGATCNAVTGGDFTVRSGVTNNDEFGTLSATVNNMITGLYERFELSRYVSTSTIDSLGDVTTSRNEILTLLFTDIRGFTSFTESNEPAEVVETLNHILSLQTELIIEEGGDIDKYVGDEIVAVFTGDACDLRACRAALSIQRAMADDTRTAQLHVGVGINHGAAILGEVGSSVRADFTVIGDNVNVAARLCSAAGPGEILISESVSRELEEGLVNTLGAALDGPYRMEAKGKSQPMRVFKLRQESPRET